MTDAPLIVDADILRMDPTTKPIRPISKDRGRAESARPAGRRVSQQMMLGDSLLGREPGDPFNRGAAPTLYALMGAG